MLYKKEYWWMWLLLFIFTGGTMTIFMASDLKLLDKDAWYMNPKNWIIATLCLVFPVTIMFVVFTIEMTCKVAAKLEIPGKELYLSPYVWLLLLIIPVLGWILFMTLVLFIYIRIIVSIYEGKLDKLK